MSVVFLEYVKLSLGAVYTVLVGVYFKYRTHPEITVRSPVLTFIANVALVLFLPLDALINLGLGEHISCASYVLILSVNAILLMECWVLIAGSLYIAFNLAQQQLSLMDQATDDSKKMKILGKITLYQTLLQTKTRVLFIIGGITLTLVVEAVVIIQVPVVLTTSYADKHTIQAQYQTLESSSAAINGLLTAMLLWIAINLRIVVDSLGIKSMLRSVGKSVLVFLVMFVGGTQVLNSILPTATHLYRTILMLIIGPLVLIPSIVMPLYKALTKVEGGNMTVEGTGLEAFLRVPKYSDAFRKHLKSEYSVENLQFWLAADKFEQSFNPESGHHIEWTNMSTKAAEIYFMFLRQGAPQEVNLPSHMLKSFREKVFASLKKSGTVSAVSPADMTALEVSFDVFAAAKDSLFELLKADSFGRFLQNPEYESLWKEFQQVQMEMNVMKTLKKETTGWLGAGTIDAGTTAKSSKYIRRSRLSSSSECPSQPRHGQQGHPKPLVQ